MTGIFLRATAVTLWWNGYRNKSQHRKLTVAKQILLPLLPGLEPAIFQSQVRRSTTELSPLSNLRQKGKSFVFMICDLFAKTEIFWCYVRGMEWNLTFNVDVKHNDNND